MKECVFCGEEEEYNPLIPMPLHFYYKGEKIPLHCSNPGDRVCLDCLETEIQNTMQVDGMVR